MTIGRPFVGDLQMLLTAILLLLGCLLIVISIMARRAMQLDLAVRARHFVPDRRKDDQDASPAKLAELQELRSQFLFLRAVEIYGIGYFLALPALFFAVMFQGLKPAIGRVAFDLSGISGNLAVVVAAVSTLWICHAYLCHRLAAERMLGLADRLCHIRHKSYE